MAFFRLQRIGLIMSAFRSLASSVVIAALSTGMALAQEDVADIPSQELRADDDPQKRYFLIGPTEQAEPPAEGFGLIVVLPGGDGSADFHPFVKRIFKHAVPDGYLVAQPVAPRWSSNQKITWPTAKNRVAGMKFTTEAFVAAVIDDVAGRQKIDAARVFTLSWSSGGPAAYAVSLSDGKVAGSFVAMSVFNPRWLPPLKNAKDQAYYLYHSPDDRVCPYRMAEQAVRDLKRNGAKVELKTYEGGHGWKGNLYDDIRAGIGWLDAHRKTAVAASEP